MGGPFSELHPELLDWEQRRDRFGEKLGATGLKGGVGSCLNGEYAYMSEGLTESFERLVAKKDGGKMAGGNSGWGTIGPDTSLAMPSDGDTKPELQRQFLRRGSMTEHADMLTEKRRERFSSELETPPKLAAPPPPPPPPPPKP